MKKNKNISLNRNFINRVLVDKKGFVSSAVLYSLLLLFLALVLGLLALLSNRKQILDKLKGDIKSEISQTKNYKKYENGTAIYYNPVTGKICGDYIENNSKTGVTEGCLKWYIFNDDKNKATVNMILDHNTTATVAWNSSEDNKTGLELITTMLAKDTAEWKGTSRLITANEVSKITGNTSFNSETTTSSGWFYFETNTTTEPNPYKGTYAWLYDNTYKCTNYGCNTADNNKYEDEITGNTNNIFGYWTSSPMIGSSNFAWRVFRYGSFTSSSSDVDNYYGIRPVITITKKQIETSDVYDVYDNGEIVYYNPVTGKVCYDYVEANSKTGIKDGCLKWYIFNDNENKSIVNMILDHNTTALVAYNSTGTNTEIKEAKTALENDTSNWKQKNTARLISADEIAEITGATKALKWNSSKIFESTPVKGTSISYFYLDGSVGGDEKWQTQIANSTNKSKYAWLYDNTYGCTSYGCNISDDNEYENGNNMYAYWTSTPVNGSSKDAWYIHRQGFLHYHVVDGSNSNGIRPVISIYKDEIKYDTFEIAYNYTGSEQSFTAPVSGKYKIEAWGAQGFTTRIYRGGYGAYSVGNIHLNKDSNIYVYVGETGGIADVNNQINANTEYHSYPNGGYAYGTQADWVSVGAGGGSTHISSENKLIVDLNNNLDKLLIVASGGGSATSHIGTDGNYGWSGYGGDGGGIIGGDAKNGVGTFYNGKGGTQTLGGYGGWQSRKEVLDGSFGMGTRNPEYIATDSELLTYAGSGGGFYGGGGSWGSGGGGGSSYIGNSLLTDKAMYCYNCTESTDENTKTISTTNVSETPTSKYAKIGNGYAKITYLGNE